MIYLVTNQGELFSSDNYKIVTVEESLEILKPLKVVGLDTETEGFSPYLKKLLLLQLGNRDNQVVIDCRTVDITPYKEYLESDRLFLGWNLKFDIKFLFHHNIILKKIYDGFLAEKMIWLGYPSGMHSLSLKSAGYNYLGVELDKSIRGQILWRKELTDEIIKYAACDVQYLEDIARKQYRELYKRGQKRALQIECLSVNPIAYFEYCGVKINRDKWIAKMKKDEERLLQSQDKLNKYVIDLYERNKGDLKGFWVNEWHDFSNGEPKGKWKLCNTTPVEDNPGGSQYGCDYKYISREFPFIEIAQPDLFGFTAPGPKCSINWNSSKQVIPLLEFFGFDLMVKDKATGIMKKSIDASVVEKQKHKHPIAEVYLDFKAAQKVVSTYGQNYLDLINPVTGRIHTQFNQIGTDTNRLSSGGGEDTEVIPGRKIALVNLQNIPADEETRACFESEKGNAWISEDFASEESVILANISKDEKMLDIFRQKGDLHSLVAKMCFPDQLKDIDVKDIKRLRPDLRKAAKSPEFTLGYGGNADTMANKDNIPKEEAITIERNYREGFKGVDAYQTRQRSLVMKLGYIDTCPEIGYRTYIYDYDKLKETQEQFNEQFWEEYRRLKIENPEDPIVQEVRHYFKRKAASERQSINYPIQARASAIYKIAMIEFFDWVVKNNLFRVVKFCIPVHDESNVEAPMEIAEEVASKLHECMVNAGKFICKIVPLDADISRLKDGSLPNYWIH